MQRSTRRRSSELDADKENSHTQSLCSGKLQHLPSHCSQLGVNPPQADCEPDCSGYSTRSMHRPKLAQLQPQQAMQAPLSATKCTPHPSQSRRLRSNPVPLKPKQRVAAPPCRQPPKSQSGANIEDANAPPARRTRMRVRRALDLQSSASTAPHSGPAALTAMHGQSSMLGMPSAAAVAGLGPWQASVHGPVVPSLHAGSASTVAITRLGMAGLARPPPAKRSLSPIAEHSDMSPVAVRTRASRRMAPCADGAASCFAALKLSDKQDGS